MYLANQRAGTHHTLRRGEVAGSTKKLFRQKGTGNARAGTKRTNKRRGGGTAKGPKPRDYEYHLPKKAVRAATRMAILSKFQRQRGRRSSTNSALAAPKTKESPGCSRRSRSARRRPRRGEKDVTLLDTTVLIGTAELDPNVYKSARNIEGVKVLPAAEFNCYTVLKQKRLVLTGRRSKPCSKPRSRPTASRNRSRARPCERKVGREPRAVRERGGLRRMATSRPHPKKYVRKLARRKPCVHGKPGLELRPYQVILRPLVTEKGTHQSTRHNAYTFEVNPLATKTQIKAAVEELFNVRVEDVRTQNRHGKKRRFRQAMGQMPNWKKAIVTLHTDDKIEFF